MIFDNSFLYKLFDLFILLEDIKIVKGTRLPINDKRVPLNYLNFIGLRT